MARDDTPSASYSELQHREHGKSVLVRVEVQLEEFLLFPQEPESISISRPHLRNLLPARDGRVPHSIKVTQNWIMNPLRHM